VCAHFLLWDNTVAFFYFSFSCRCPTFFQWK
jgi:hypothetical protein